MNGYAASARDWDRRKNSASLGIDHENLPKKIRNEGPGVINAELN